jgi:hypothetical protein
VDGIAINKFCTAKREASRHQLSGAPHGRLVFLLTRYKVLQFSGQQCADTAAALCSDPSSPLQKIPVNGDSDVVLAYGGHGGTLPEAVTRKLREDAGKVKSDPALLVFPCKLAGSICKHTLRVSCKLRFARRFLANPAQHILLDRQKWSPKKTALPRF